MASTPPFPNSDSLSEGEVAPEPKVGANTEAEAKVDGDLEQTAIQSNDIKNTPSAEQSAKPELPKDEGNQTFTMRELLNELKDGEGNSAAGEGEKRDTTHHYRYGFGFLSVNFEETLISAFVAEFSLLN